MANVPSPAATDLQALWLNQPRAGSEWLLNLQRAAIEQFNRAGFPSTRNEDWKYTDISELAELYPDWLQRKPAKGISALRRPLAIPDAIHLVFIDGIFQPAQSTQDLPACVLAGNLAQLAADHPDIIEARLGQLSPTSDSAFVALNTAFGGDCAVLVLPANTTLARPVYIEYWSASASTGCHPRLIVDLGENSKATLIEHHCGTAATFVNAVAEISVGRAAHFNYYKLQEMHREAWHTAVQNLRIDIDARVDSTVIDSGAGLARNQLHVCLAGIGAVLEAQGLLLADDSQHVDSRITVEHAEPHTTSRERYRAILGGKARGVFNGRILVRPDAQKSDAALTNRNLLLNRGAEIDTKPELEIYADDVKCAHGSSTGQLDETALFYLLSRGIDLKTARNMLIKAFAEELLAGIAIPGLSDRMHQIMESMGFNDL